MMYVLLAGLVGLAVVVGIQFRILNSSRNAARDASCVTWQNFDAVLIKQIRAGEKAAGGLAYYKRHPDELNRVIRADEKFVQLLVPPDYC